MTLLCGMHCSPVTLLAYLGQSPGHNFSASLVGRVRSSYHAGVAEVCTEGGIFKRTAYAMCSIIGASLGSVAESLAGNSIPHGAKLKSLPARLFFFMDSSRPSAKAQLRSQALVLAVAGEKQP
jgi:hypothetical protein